MRKEKRRFSIYVAKYAADYLKFRKKEILLLDHNIERLTTNGAKI